MPSNFTWPVIDPAVAASTFLPARGRLAPALSVTSELQPAATTAGRQQNRGNEAWLFHWRMGNCCGVSSAIAPTRLSLT